MISFDGMLERGTTSIGFANELVKVFAFLGAEDSEEVDAFLFFRAAHSAALVFFTSNAEGRIGLGVGVGAGGAEEIGSFSSGTTDAVALVGSVSSGTTTDASAGLACSSGTTLVVALAMSSAAGIASSAWYF